MKGELSHKTALEFIDSLISAVLDKEGNYLYVSRLWQEIMGFSSEEAIGKKVYELVPDTHAMDALRTGKVIRGRPVVKNGVPVFTTYIPRLDASGRVKGLFLYVVVNGIPNAQELLHQTALLTDQVDYYRQELSRVRGARYQLDNIIGNSPAILQLKEQIIQASKSTSTVLIEGETGSGKELIAHAIHGLSPRRDANFVRVNCSAIPAELMESEFFGYAAGAFTGASKKGKVGRFELANGGSLFLDEINLLTPTIQPKFLRVLQEREIDPVGGSRTVPVDVRVIAATNIPLERLVEQGDFRSDLYFRLNVIRIVAPPLRERREDIPLLVENLIQRLNAQLGMLIQGVSDSVMDLLMSYEWPGNVRELQNAIESAMNMASSSVLQKSDFDQLVKRMHAKSRHTLMGCEDFRLKSSKLVFEREMIRDALAAAGGNRVRAAQMLGISRTVLYKKLKQYDLS